MKNPKIMPIISDTYLAVVKNSVGSRIFRNFYVKIGGRKIDITKNGVFSCAWFVSSVLSLFRLIKEPHLTVDSTVKDLKKSGWKRVKKPKIGSILIWEANLGEDGWHRYIGFYIGNGQAVSNSTKSRKIAGHHWTFGVKNGKPKRKVEEIFWNPKLD
jgi:hypothetical protein